jgi:GWxTD domain-containing protein
MIPLKKEEAHSINVKVLQNEKAVIEEEIESIGSTAVGIMKCDGKIVFQSLPSGQKVNLFILKNFNKKLVEGKSEIIITANDEEKSYEFDVDWVDKPVSLEKPELAIELLQNIVDKEEVKTILDADEEDYYDKLNEFWVKRDPNKETSFNEIMQEFYSRADFAISNYSTLDKKNGALSDRGRIYIKFGEPKNIVRKYIDNNGVIEIWKYENSDREFKFIDNSGLGNFTLM